MGEGIKKEGKEDYQEGERGEIDIMPQRAKDGKNGRGSSRQPVASLGC